MSVVCLDLGEDLLWPEGTILEIGDFVVGHLVGGRRRGNCKDVCDEARYVCRTSYGGKRIRLGKELWSACDSIGRDWLLWLLTWPHHEPYFEGFGFNHGVVTAMKLSPADVH